MALLAALAALAVVASAPAWGVIRADGDLIASFEARLNPSALPRSSPAPVSVSVAGDLRSASGQLDALPQLRRIVVAINREGRLTDRGLPVCRARRIQPSTPRRARRVCGGAEVGGGHAIVRVHLGSQPPFTVKARLIAFNGPRRNGNRLIFAHAFAPDPPGSFLLTFEVTRQPGQFGTVLTTVLPRATRGWAYLTHFDLTLHRTYRYRGQRRSYVSASCAAPAGFDSAVFTFARTTYNFAGGRSLSMSETSTCRVSGE